MNKTFTRRALRTHAAMIPIIGAVRQSSAVVYKLERRDPETGQLNRLEDFPRSLQSRRHSHLAYGRNWTSNGGPRVMETGHPCSMCHGSADLPLWRSGPCLFLLHWKRSETTTGVSAMKRTALKRSTPLRRSSTPLRPRSRTNRRQPAETKYVRWVRTLACAVCDFVGASEAAHTDVLASPDVRRRHPTAP
jgi:hypothetical protein